MSARPVGLCEPHKAILYRIAPRPAQGLPRPQEKTGPKTRAPLVAPQPAPYTHFAETLDMAADERRQPWRTTPPLHGRAAEFDETLDRVCGGIRDPVLKLQYIRQALQHYEVLKRRVGWVPWSRLRRAMYQWLSIEHFRSLVRSELLPPRSRRQLQRSLALSRVTFVLSALAFVALLAGLGTAVAILAPATAARMAPLQPPAPPRVATAPVPAPAQVQLPGTAPSAIAPTSVWLVEKGSGWEQYSNGLRIDTQLAVRHTRRRYRVFRESGMQPELYSQPVGIVFHTSESDLWPMEADFNANLRDSSQRLLRYIQRLKLYNYVIDRFGRVYRVVEEDCKANHAGYSVWSYGGRVYLNLNHAFFGVCFETRWEGGKALPMTAAQYAAGRALTDCLMQRFAIVPGMCVGHGMVSVNPTKHLLGHHLDWARGFPFESFGLPDQYRQPSPAVALFGFRYDEEFVKTMGEPWPGVRSAERELLREARTRGVVVEQLYHEKQSLFDAWLQQQAQDEQLAAPDRAEQASFRGPHGG